MSQISLPWTSRDPQVLAGYRVKAVRRLLGIGGFLAILGVVLFAACDLNAPRVRDWRIAVTYLGVLGPVATGVALIVGGLAVIFYRWIGALLRAWYFAFGVLCGAVAGTCLAVWAYMQINGFMQRTFPAGEIVSAEGIFAAIRNVYPVPVAAYLLWPLQFELLRDVIAVGAVFGLVSVIAAFGIWWERKVAGRIQSRLGPMRVGGWHGWAQSPADGIKLVLKEDLVPDGSDGVLFRLAPYVAFIPPMCAFVALPFAGAYVFRDLDVALILILALLGLDVIGTILAGWASNNKWSVYGAMREACQMVSYEIPMGMALLIPVMMAGSLKLTTVVEMQGGGFHSWLAWSNPWCFVAFFCYFIAALASCKRAPFDLPEAESELVAGFHTEYSGFRWSLFFFGEYAGMFAVCGLAVILFLGGWKSPLPQSWAPTSTAWYALMVRGLLFDGPILFLLKAMFLLYVQLWVRWTLPRIRIDQVLYACVQVLLPLTMLVLLGNTLWILGTEHLELGWLIWIDRVLHWFLVAVAGVLVAGMIGVATYGFVNKRRLVGRLAIEHLPGS